MPYFFCDRDDANVLEFPRDVEAYAYFEEEYGYTWINGDDGAVRECDAEGNEL